MQMLKLEEQEFLGEATCLLSEVLANGIFFSGYIDFGEDFKILYFLVRTIFLS
jgi:hypothetical protein